MPGEAPPTPASVHQPLFLRISATAARECACEDLVGEEEVVDLKKKKKKILHGSGCGLCPT